MSIKAALSLNNVTPARQTRNACLSRWCFCRTKMRMSSFLLDCELHFLNSPPIDVGEDKGVVQCFALLHRLLDVFHLALGKYVLEENRRMITRHKAYLIGKR